jgi:hypothetical protein
VALGEGVGWAEAWQGEQRKGVQLFAASRMAPRTALDCLTLPRTAPDCPGLRTSGLMGDSTGRMTSCPALSSGTAARFSAIVLPFGVARSAEGGLVSTGVQHTCST